MRMDARNSWKQKPRTSCLTHVCPSTVHVTTQGLKDLPPKFEPKWNVNGTATKIDLWISFIEKSRERSQVKFTEIIVLNGKKKDRGNFSRAEISALCKGAWLCLSTQMFGSYSKYENGLFPPPSRHHLTLGPWQPLMSFKTEQTQSLLGFSKQQGRGKEMVPWCSEREICFKLGINVELRCPLQHAALQTWKYPRIFEPESLGNYRSKCSSGEGGGLKQSGSS